jgi:hypothetical protein
MLGEFLLRNIELLPPLPNSLSRLLREADFTRDFLSYLVPHAVRRRLSIFIFVVFHYRQKTIASGSTKVSIEATENGKKCEWGFLDAVNKDCAEN